MSSTTEKKRHPLQPIVRDSAGVVRFQKNRIVRYLVDTHDGGLNELARHFTEDDADWQQLAQLIGYSVAGIADLSYFDEATLQEIDAVKDAFLALEVSRGR